MAYLWSQICLNMGLSDLVWWTITKLTAEKAATCGHFNETKKVTKKECLQTNGEMDGQAKNKCALPTYIVWGGRDLIIAPFKRFYP